MLRGPEALLRQQVVRAHLLAQQRRDAFDDAIADRVAERVVVPLEPGDVDEADRAPAPALLEREERLELLGEAAEVHQLGLRVAVRLVGQVGDERFEVARDAADGRVLREQLGLDARHLVGKAGRQRLNGLVLGFLPEPFVPREDGVDGGEQRGFERRRQLEMFAHPGLQLVARLRLRFRHRHLFRSHQVALGHPLSHIVVHATHYKARTAAKLG